MTAETDAMRLVPTKATRKQLEDAAFNLSAEIGPEEALKLAPHIERAYELLVAAAPAVQPAAGEPVARKHSDKCWGRTSFSDEMAHCYCPRPIGWTNQVALDAARDHPKEAAWMWGAPNGSINIPLYAHPPKPDARLSVAVEQAAAALEPFAALARVRYPEEGGAPSWIDLMTAHGEQDEIELRSHTAASSRIEVLTGEDFRRADRAATALRQIEGG